MTKSLLGKTILVIYENNDIPFPRPPRRPSDSLGAPPSEADGRNVAQTRMRACPRGRIHMDT